MDRISEIGFLQPETNAKNWVDRKLEKGFYSFFAKYICHFWWFFKVKRAEDVAEIIIKGKNLAKK